MCVWRTKRTTFPLFSSVFFIFHFFFCNNKTHKLWCYKVPQMKGRGIDGWIFMPVLVDFICRAQRQVDELFKGVPTNKKLACEYYYVEVKIKAIYRVLHFLDGKKYYKEPFSPQWHKKKFRKKKTHAKRQMKWNEQ